MPQDADKSSAAPSPEPTEPTNPVTPRILLSSIGSQPSVPTMPALTPLRSGINDVVPPVPPTEAPGPPISDLNTVAGVGSKASVARASINKAGEETIQAVANTRAGRNLKDYWVGWSIIGFILVCGIFSIRFAIKSGERKIESNRAAAAIAASISTPRPPTAEEQEAAMYAERDRQSAQYIARYEAQKRAEAEARQRDAEAITQVMMSEAQKIQQSQTLDNGKYERERAEREREDAKPIMYECSACGQTIILPKRLTETHVAVNAEHYGGRCLKGDQYHPYHEWRKGQVAF